jgi:release factor glutamine methyltransferase
MSESTEQSLLGVLQAGQAFLERKGIENPRLVCELLLSRLLKCSRMDLYVRYEQPLSHIQLEAMRRGIKRVSLGEPVQYVVGETGFYEHVFKVDSRGLIPRPETEVLIQQVLDCAPLWERSDPVIVDVGTGSGCIVISLALARPKARYIGIDVSADALALASENAERLACAERIAFEHGELPDVVEPGSVDAIVANLPYIPTDTVDALPGHILEHEPRQALDGGSDGLIIVAQVIADAAIVLKPRGHIFLEIGDDQGSRVTTLLEREGFEPVNVIQDLTERDRVVYGCVPQPH